MEQALARHDALLRQAIDAFQAVFTTAPAALEVALAAQHALLTEHWGPVAPLRLAVRPKPSR